MISRNTFRMASLGKGTAVPRLQALEDLELPPRHERRRAACGLELPDLRVAARAIVQQVQDLVVVRVDASAQGGDLLVPLRHSRLFSSLAGPGG